MKPETIAALLGRSSLSQRETANFKKYLNIARESLEELLCISLDCRQVVEKRIFDGREGYSTVFTDIFTEVTEIKVDGTVINPSLYYPAQWDNRNASWYNSIVFKDSCKVGKEVEATGTWGFEKLPSDLQQLLAEAFALVSRKRSSSRVKSKKVEDFSVTYGDVTEDEAFINDNRRTIQKYSLCNIGYVLHGETC